MEVLNANTGKKTGSNNTGFTVKFLLFTVLTVCLLQLAFSSSTVQESFNTTLWAEIHRKQLERLSVQAAMMSPDIEFIDLASAKKLYDGQGAAFLDVRKGEYRDSIIDDAYSISLTSVINEMAAVDWLLYDKEEVIITYCSGICDAGVKMAGELVERGYKNVYVLFEGYAGWEKAGYPVSKIQEDTESRKR